MNIIDMVYPVGSIYMSTASTSPATLFGGTWVALNQGRVLIGANSTYPAGSTGGEATHKITVNELPAHKHTASTDSKGGHNHDGSTGNAGKHTHTRGTMNITGRVGAIAEEGTNYANGAFYQTGTTGTGHGGGVDYMVYFDAARENGKHWTGKTSEAIDHAHSISTAGAHTHTVTVNNTGGDANMNNMQPYLAVYMWKRTA